MEEIIKKAREWALEEIEKHGSPLLINFELSYKKGIELAQKLKLDVDVVKIGTLLMDIKLGEAKKEGCLKEHSKISADATKNFLQQFDINDELKNKIVNCVEAHHATIPFTSKESELCANADCYRFIHPKGVFAYLEHLGENKKTFEENLKQVEFKMDEKWNILSLDICKQELEDYYHTIKKYIRESQI